MATFAPPNNPELSTADAEWSASNGAHSIATHGFAMNRVLHVFVDAGLVLLNVLTAFHIRFFKEEVSGLNSDHYHTVLLQHLAFLSVYVALILFACEYQNLYRTLWRRSFSDE